MPIYTKAVRNEHKMYLCPRCKSEHITFVGNMEINQVPHDFDSLGYGKAHENNPILDLSFRRGQCNECGAILTPDNVIIRVNDQCVPHCLNCMYARQEAIDIYGRTTQLVCRFAQKIHMKLPTVYLRTSCLVVLEYPQDINSITPPSISQWTPGGLYETISNCPAFEIGKNNINTIPRK